MGREQIEKWSRFDLENKYHVLAENVNILKKKNNSLERELKILNGRLTKVGSLKKKGDEQESKNLNDLEQANKFLNQKVKVLKHQLLAYNQCTSVRKRPIPKSSRSQLQVDTSNTKAKDPFDDRDVKDDDLRSKASDAKKFSTHLSQQNEPEISMSWNRGDAHRRVESVSNMYRNRPQEAAMDTSRQEVTKWKQSKRELEAQVDELQFLLQKAETKLATLSEEYNKICEELEMTKKKLRVAQQTLSSLQDDSRRSTESQEKLTEIINKELDLLRDENKVLKETNERLINSMKHDEKSKTLFDELNRLRMHIKDIEFSLNESEIRRNKIQEEAESLKVANALLINKNSKLESQQTDNKGNYPNASSNENVVERATEKIETNSTDILNRLFGDISEMFNFEQQHKISNSLQGSNILNSFENSTEKWQKMYEQVYSDLERVRELLLAEHSLNERIKEEMYQSKAEMETTKQNYQSRIEKLKAELENQVKHVKMLENQLKSLSANSNSDFFGDFSAITATGTVPVKYDEDRTEMTLRLKKLVLSEDLLKLLDNLHPVIFLAIEFFDFEYQTTPLFQGPDCIFDFSTTFDVQVSSLFVHYLDREGINIELYDIHDGITYKQWSTITISLKRFLSVCAPTHFKGKSRFFHSFEGKKILLAELEYVIEVPRSLIKALTTHRRKLTASTFIPLSNHEAETHNELIIEIRKCTGLKKLLLQPNKYGFYIAYQIYDLPVHMTKVVTTNEDTYEFADNRSWTLPSATYIKGFHDYLENEQLQIYLIECTEDQDRIVLESGAHILSLPDVLAFVSLPLFPLARNQRIKGSFPLCQATDGSIFAEASIELLICWKFPYSYDKYFPDEASLETKIEFNNELTRKPTEIVKTQKYDEITTFDNSNVKVPEPVKDINGINDATKGTFDAPQISDGSNEERSLIIKPDSHIIPLNDEAKNFKPEEKSLSESSLEASTKSQSEHYDMQLNYSGLQVQEPSGPQSSPPSTSTSAEEQFKTIGSPPSVRSSSSNGEFKLSSRTESVPSSPSSNSASYLSSESRGEHSEMDENAVKKQHKGNADYENKTLPEQPMPAIRKSLLGDLPSLAQLPKEAKFEEIRQQTGSTKRTKWSDPLHSSIPPSESSSIVEDESQSSQNSNSTDYNEAEDLNESKLPPQPIARSRINQKKMELPLLAAHPPRSSVLRQREKGDAEKMWEMRQSEEENLSDEDAAQIKMHIGCLRLINPSFFQNHPDNAQVFVEWTIIDIDREFCQTQGTITLPRSFNELQDFNFDTTYKLNERQKALLKQWTNLGIRMTFTLVLDPGDKGNDFDDLCVGELNLADVLHSSKILVTMRNVDNIPLALLDLIVTYSENLKLFLEE